ncbi:MAG: HEPN domain-containing protein [Candidatus Hodarchaeota archaeon]
MADRSQNWFEQALGDLCAAENLFHSENFEWVCFICQQDSEKALKAFLEKEKIPKWGPDLLELYQRAEQFTSPSKDVRNAFSRQNLY